MLCKQVEKMECVVSRFLYSQDKKSCKRNYKLRKHFRVFQPINFQEMRAGKTDHINSDIIKSQKPLKNKFRIADF